MFENSPSNDWPFVCTRGVIGASGTYPTTQNILEQPPTFHYRYALRKKTLNKRFSRVISAGSNSTSHGVKTQLSSMTAVTPVASKKARPTVDFNASPLSDRTRHLFPSISDLQLVKLNQDDTEELPSSSPSPIVLLRTGDPGEDSNTSSPIISIGNDDLREEDPITVTYRSTKNLPHELETHCNIYLEERLYDKAIILLNNLLISGASYPTASKAWLPPKNQIAFIMTILVHPTFTTRATPSERADISSQALILLRNVLCLLGPSKAKLSECFAFRPNLTPRRSRRERAVLPTIQRVPYGEEPINSKLANEGSLWLRAHDFWQVVGWAFNCSIHHRGRWNVWKIWLEYMLDVLEADWKEVSQLHDDEDTKKKRADSKAMDDMYQNCILIQYVSEATRSSTAVRRIIKSIFVDGSVDALKAYPEVFNDETREANAKTGTKRKREVKLNLDEDDYGDYLQNEDDDDKAPTPSQSDISSPSATDDSSNILSIASITEDPEAVIIRLRLLALLSLASFTAPSLFVPILELYKIYVEVIKPLPLPAFALFVSPSAIPHLPLVALSSVVQAHLSQLLPWGAPRPNDDVLTQMNLERCFLPFAANTSSIEDNAKVSLLVETLFRLLATHGGIGYTPELIAAIDKGIQAREKKCTGTRKKKSGSAKDDEDMVWLNASAERMRLLLGYYKKAS